MTVVIERALASDAGAIARLAASLVLGARDQAVPSETGFLLWAGDAAKYTEIIENSGYCYVARVKTGIGGFLTAVTPERIQQLPLSETGKMLQNEAGEYPLLIEQIAVSSQWSGIGIGEALLRRIEADSPYPRTVAMIVHGPLRNEAGVRFFKDRPGWRLVREIHGRLRWGMYERITAAEA